jgi:hypothetical protein
VSGVLTVGQLLRLSNSALLKIISPLLTFGKNIPVASSFLNILGDTDSHLCLWPYLLFRNIF